MIQKDRNDAIMVRIIKLEDDGTEKLVCCYYTTAIDQTLRMFLTAKECEVECRFNEFSAEIPESLLQSTYYVEDVHIIIGTNSDIAAIEVVIK